MNLPENGGCLWWHGGAGLVGSGPIRRMDVATGPDRGRDAFKRLRDVLRPDGVAFASFTFDPESEGSVLLVADRLDRIDTLPAPSGGQDRPRFAGARMDEMRWMEEVARTVELIATSEVSKVVLARDEVLWSKQPFSERDIALRLAAAFPGCYTFVCDGLVGATPELLVRKAGPSVTSMVLAGSARRGRDDADDLAAAEALRSSPKEREEHELAVASVTEALGEVCNDVKAEAEPHLLRLVNVQHLATTVSAQLRDSDVSALELVDVLHPTAAVGGVPRNEALARIRAVEGDLRGRYAGPVGWVDRNGNGEFGIALRCASIDGDRARLFAGAGIVEASLPEDELEETRLKFRAMEGALGL